MTNSVENNIVSTCTVSSSCSFGTENLPVKKRKEERNDGVPILPNTTTKVTLYGWARSSPKMTDICFFYHRHRDVSV